MHSHLFGLSWLCCRRVVLSVIIARLISPAEAQDLTKLRELKGQFNSAMNKSQFADAEKYARGIVEIADASFSNRPDVVAEALYMHGMVIFQLGSYVDAERAMERQITTIQKITDEK